ncbi:MAG: SsrA-binding protein SmpB [Planctomycetes bacterium]|nr:SsrA-binding protein SmpB [Planctomycetota bacterium]
MTAKPDKARRTVARNRRATHDYAILDRIEAGLVLTGTEVKSLRKAEATLVGSYIRIDDDRMCAWLIGCQIPEYSHGTYANHEPKRKRKLLLHAREIVKLRQSTKTDGTTIIPLEIYFEGPWAKVQIGLAKGKRKSDKRQAIASREAKRDIDRTARGRR